MTAPAAADGATPWNRDSVVREAVSHAALWLFASIGGIGYFGVVLILLAEMVLVNALSIAMFPERRWGRHIAGLCALLVLVAFTTLFLVATYDTVMAGKSNGVADGMDALMRVDSRLLVWGSAHSAVMLAATFLHARASLQPRLVWARLALVQGAITMVAFFCLVLLLAMLGPLLAAALRQLAPGLSPDGVLVLLAVVVRLGIALAVSRMPETRWQRIAERPYDD